MNQVEIQETKSSERENRTLVKALLIATNKRVRRSQVNESRNIWLVGSASPRTPNKFYKVMYDEGLEEIVCDCKAYEFGATIRCCHIFACAIFEGSDKVVL